MTTNFFPAKKKNDADDKQLINPPTYQPADFSLTNLYRLAILYFERRCYECKSPFWNQTSDFGRYNPLYRHSLRCFVPLGYLRNHRAPCRKIIPRRWKHVSATACSGRHFLLFFPHLRLLYRHWFKFKCFFFTRNSNNIFINLFEFP